jgi:hypothetical protein
VEIGILAESGPLIIASLTRGSSSLSSAASSFHEHDIEVPFSEIPTD